jgi:hypothetical protein
VSLGQCDACAFLLLLELLLELPQLMFVVLLLLLEPLLELHLLVLVLLLLLTLLLQDKRFVTNIASGFCRC